MNLTKKWVLSVATLLLSGAAFAQIPVTPPGGGGSAGVASINGSTGAFTFAGAVSCATTTCTFTGGGATIPSTTNLLAGDGAGNGANSGIVPANVMTLSGTQTVTGAKTFSANLSNTSTTATTATAPTVNITDNEATSALMVPFTILTPNMAAGASTVNTYIGHDASTARNAFQSTFAYVASNSTANRLEMKFSGQAANLTMEASGNVQVGTNADAGFKLDVAGTFRAQTSVTSPQYTTSGTTQGVDILGVGTGTVSTTGWPTNYVGIAGPASGTVAYVLQLPSAAPAAGQSLSCATPGTVNGINQSVCIWAPALYVPQTATASFAAGITSVTCVSSTCTSNRGTYSVVSASFTTGTFATLTWAATPTAQVCLVSSGSAPLGHSLATTTGMTIDTGTALGAGTLSFDYSCQP